MEPVEDIRLKLDEIGIALKRLTSESQNKSQSVEDFHNRISVIFPQIIYQSAEPLWDDEPKVDNTLMPIWWDDLDEPFVLDEHYWLIQIQKMGLLSSQDLIRLITAVEAGVLAEAALENEMYPDLLEKYGVEMFKQVVEIGREANDEIVVRNLKLVLYIARNYTRKIAIEDAFSYGVIGLMHAVKKFDWRLGNQFSTYATWWIRQSITRAIAETSTTISIPVHAFDRLTTYNRELNNHFNNEFTSAGDVTTKNKNGEIIEATQSLSIPIFKPELNSTLMFALSASAPAYDFWNIYIEAPWLLEKYETSNVSIVDSEFMSIAGDLERRLIDFVLSKRELEVLLFRHGILNGEPQTLEGIGNRIGLTRERIRQIEKKALFKLNLFLEEVTIGNYWAKIEDAAKTYEQKIEKDVSLQLPTITRDECGSEPGYRQHRTKYEEPCQACKRAHQELGRIYKDGRPKPYSSVPAKNKNWTSLTGTNKERSMIAAANQVIQVRWALEKLENATLPDPMLLAAKARLNYPEASLSELAGYLGAAVTKDAVAGYLRRLVGLAETHSGELRPIAVCLASDPI